MMLRSIDFIESENKPLEWRLEGLALGQINLLVGRNASGKSKALGAIGNLAGLVSGMVKPTGHASSALSYSVLLTNQDPSSETQYRLDITDSRVSREELTIGGESKIRRGPGGAGEIYFNQLSKYVEFQCPEDDLACVSRRDSIQHPYLDILHGWGRGALSYRFNSLELGKHTVVSIPQTRNSPDEDRSTWPVQAIYKAGTEESTADFKSSILADMRQLGYALTDIELRIYDDVPKRLRSGNSEEKLYHVLYVTEEGLSAPIDQFAMSDGMFRALSVLIQVNFAAMRSRPSCVLIDDVGEGLDYERSCLLIKLLIDKANRTGVQLVMATNDRFVMNNVPLEYWTVLVRERAERGTKVRVYNYGNHKQIFDDFAYTGLNNFDFFASRFFEEGLREGE